MDEERQFIGSNVSQERITLHNGQSAPVDSDRAYITPRHLLQPVFCGYPQSKSV